MPIMTTSQKKRPLACIVLIILVAFLSISAIPAGAALALDPSGANLQVPTDALRNGPFNDYLIPSLFLLLILGI